MATCPRCGWENPSASRFCADCGARLEAAPAARSERKIVTVLFADLVGFTARSEQLDPEEVAAFLQPYHVGVREELERFGGTVEKFIGDAVMALFGAPVAHDDDPERAVRAALAIQDSVAGQDLHVRIGINTGEALVALGARVTEGEGMAAGDVVNTAARLQTAAPVDGVLVGEATYRATSEVVEYRPAEPIAAKGKTAPVRAWEALRIRARPERGPATPFVGRSGELAQLVHALDLARTRGAPQLVTVLGAPGIGKTRLIDELTARDGAARWLHGRSLPYGEGVAYSALAEIVKKQASILSTDDAARVEAKLESLVAETTAADPGDRDWLLRHLRPLLGLGGAGELVERRDEVFAAWRRLFEELARAGPLALVVEDLHWADDGVLDFFEELGTAARGPILVVCAARFDLLQRRPAWGGGAARIALEPLADEDAARLISELAGDGGVVARNTGLLARVGGNPLFAEQYVRMLVERGPANQAELPDSVQATIAARLDALPAAEKGLLQDAAVVGAVFWAGAVASLGEGDAGAAGATLRRLEQSQLVLQERSSTVAGEAEFRFHHALVRDVAYAQIPRSDRARKHLRAAGWLQGLAEGRSDDRAQLVGHHYLAALEYAHMSGQDTEAFSAAAQAALQEAGTRAFWLGAYASAARFSGAALELLPSGHRDRPELLFEHGRALFWAEDAGLESMVEAIDALAAQGELEAAAEAASWTSKAVWMQGDRDATYRFVDRALELVAELPESRARAEVMTRRAGYDMFAGDYASTIRSCREALPVVERLGLDALESRLLNLLGTSHVFTGDAAGTEEIEQSIKIARRLSSADLLWSGSENLFSAQMHLGRLHAASATRVEMTESLERRGPPHLRRWAMVDAVRDHFARGAWDDAVAMADEFLTQVDAGSPHYLEPPGRALRSAIRLARGDRAGAADDAEKGLAAGRRAQDVQVLAPALWSGAAISVEQGRREVAGQLVSELLAGSPPGAWNLMEWGCLPDFVWTLVDLGRGPELEPLLADAPPAPWTDAAAAIVAGDLGRAVATLAAIGNPGGEASSRLRWAEALVAEDRAAEADEVLAPALAFYRSVGATLPLARAEALTVRA